MFEEIVRLATEAVRMGRQRASMKMLVEVIRWNRFVRYDNDTVKINNNFTSHYSRLLAAEHPELGRLFETRQLRAS